MVIKTENSLEIQDYEQGVKIEDYDSFKFTSPKIVLGDNDSTIEADFSGELKFNVRTDLSRFQVSKNGTTLIKLNLYELAEKVYFSQTKILIILHGVTEAMSTQISMLFLYIGQTNLKKLKEVWKRLEIVQANQDRLFEDLRTTQVLLRTLRNYKLLNLQALLGTASSTLTPIATPQDTSQKSLKDKNFASLLPPNRRPTSIGGKASRINTPKNTLTDGTPNKFAPTPPKAFYAPSPASRLTRSASKKLTSDDYDDDDDDADDHIPKESILIDDIDRPISKRGRREVFKPSLVYKFQDNSSYKIRNLDYQCLYRGQWINDTLIDFFLKFFAEDSIKRGFLTKEDLHIFTTFFFTKLKSTISYYQNIERWVSKIDFSSKKYIIVPINESLHWYCSIIVGFDKILSNKDKDSKCTIYVFDSLRQDHKSILKPLRTFLLNYAKDKFDLDIDPKRIQLRPSAVPKQPNFNDCGIHVMYNVSRFFENPQGCLDIWNTEHGVNRHTLANFFKKKDREDMRDKLRKILKQLQAEQSPRDDDSDQEGLQEAESQAEDEDDIVYIDANEFNELKSKAQSTKETSTEGEEVPNKEGKENPDDKLEEKVEMGANKEKKIGITNVDKLSGEPLEEVHDEDQERFFSSQNEKDDFDHVAKETPNKTESEESTNLNTDKRSQDVKSPGSQLTNNDTDADTQIDSQIQSQIDNETENSQLESHNDVIQIDPLPPQDSKKEPYEEVPATQESQENPKDESEENHIDADADAEITKKKDESLQEDDFKGRNKSPDGSQELIEDFEQKSSIDEREVKPPSSYLSSDHIQQTQDQDDSQLEFIEIKDSDSRLAPEKEEQEEEGPRTPRMVIETDCSSPLSDVSSYSSPKSSKHNDVGDGDLLMDDVNPAKKLRKKIRKRSEIARHTVSRYFAPEANLEQEQADFDMKNSDSSLYAVKPLRVISRPREKSKGLESELIEVHDQEEPEITERELTQVGKESISGGDKGGIEGYSHGGLNSANLSRERGSLGKAPREVVTIDDEPSYREEDEPTLAERPSGRK